MKVVMIGASGLIEADDHVKIERRFNYVYHRQHVLRHAIIHFFVALPWAD